MNAFTIALISNLLLLCLSMPDNAQFYSYEQLSRINYENPNDNNGIPKWGEIIGSIFHVPAYCNLGLENPNEKQIGELSNFLPPEVTGLKVPTYSGVKYQAVEFSRRFLILQKDVSFGDVDNPSQIFQLSSVDDLLDDGQTLPFHTFVNGGKEAPIKGDLLIWNKKEDSEGHVAVISNVNLQDELKYIDIGEQNYDAIWQTPNYSRRLVLQVNGGRYIVTNTQVDSSNNDNLEDAPILGWKRVNRPLNYEKMQQTHAQAIQYEYSNNCEVIPKWGEVIGSILNVPAYCNIGKENPDEKQMAELSNFLKPEETGLKVPVYSGVKYQCVEYGRRFLILQFNVSFGDVDSAYQIYNINNVTDLTQDRQTFPFLALANAGKVPPKFGDLLIWNKTLNSSDGHVAVISNVNLQEKYIDIGEQNYANTWQTQNYSRRLILEILNDRYIVTNQQVGSQEIPDEPILGWMRVEKEQIQKQ